MMLQAAKSTDKSSDQLLIRSNTHSFILDDKSGLVIAVNVN